MSGTTIPYADRPMGYMGPGGVYATPEFLQYLERLSGVSGNIVITGSAPPRATPSAATMAATAASTKAAAKTTSDVATLTTEVNAALADLAWARSHLTSLLNQFPVSTVVAPGAAVALTSGTVTQIASTDLATGAYIMIGTVYLTGAGSVTLAEASAGLNAGTIEAAPGAFATAEFGAGASPGSLGVDLSIGSFVQQLRVDAPETAYLNVRATFSGAISAYGSLICWRVGD